MKTNLFTHRINTFGKRLAMLIIMLLVVGVGSAWGAETTYTFNSKSWGDSSAGWTSGKDGNQFTSNQGVQVTTGVSGANATTKSSISNVSTIVVTYCTNASKGAGTISVQVGSNTAKSFSVTKPSSGGTTLKTTTFTFNPNESGQVKISVTCTANSIYIHSVTITTADAVSCTTAPTVSAGSNSNVTTNSATVTCSEGITSLGSTGCSITSYGFVYGTSSNPTTSNTKVQVGTSYTTTGTSFSKSITGLSANTTYYVRPYATNGYGTAYGTQTSFKTKELAKYTVTFNAGGGTCSTTTLTESSAGVGITLPTATLNDCGDWSFAGWAEASVATETTTAPATLLAAGSNYKPTANCTLYAVYQRTETTSGGGGGETGSVTMQYSGSTTNMSEGNNAETVGLDANEWSVVPTKGSASNMPGLNKDGDIRLYGHASGGNYLTISSKSYTITTVTITYTSESYNNGKFYVNGNETDASNINANEFVIKNANSGTTQVRIKSLVINYTTSGGGSSSTSYYHSAPDCGSTPITPTQLDAPTNLNETDITSTSATLSWDAVANASSYVVTVVDGGAYSETFTTTSPSINITGLTAETDYLWTVQAIGDGTNYTNSEESETGEFTTIFSGYTITYETNGGDAIASVVAMVLPDPLPTAKRTHYTFEGWYTDAECTTAAVAGAALNADITLYAKWSPKVYLTILHPNEGILLDTNGTQQDSIIIEYVYGTSAVDIPVANYYQSITREGYKFKGWYNVISGGNKWPNIAQGKNQNLWAQWLEERTVTYYSIGQVYDTQTYGSGETLTLPTTNPTACDGYTFVGWTTAEQSETTTKPTLVSNTTVVSSDMNLYAVYKRTEEGGSAGSTETTVDVSISNYATANSWSNATNYSTVMIDGNITATAVGGSNTGKYYSSGTNWRFYQTESSSLTISAATGCTINNVTITYSVSNTGVLKYSGSNVTSGKTVTVNASSVTFGVGNTGSATNGQVRITNISVTYTTSNGTATTYTTSPNCCPVNLEKPQVTYSVADGAVTLNWTMTNNVSDVSDYTVACVGGETYTTTATSYTFTGLNNCTEYTFTVKANGDGTDVCSSGVTTVTATPAAGSFVVTFDYGAGEGTPTQWTSGCANGTSTTLPTPTTLPDNHTFEGWYDGTNLYAAGDNYTPTSDVTLYARYTRDTAVDIVEWDPDAITIEVNTDGSAQVQIENEVEHGLGVGSAEELFFSKYYEASYNVKLVAIYNGTKNIIDLTDYTIKYGKTSWESNYIALKDFGSTKGQIQPGEEIILYSMTDGSEDEDIMDCVHADYPDGNWVRVTQSNNTGGGHLSFAGDKTLVLRKSGEIIDIIGAVTSSGLPTNAAVTRPSWGDNTGWTCAAGLSIADATIGISTNRCLLIRNNDVTSGANAVANNIGDFVTLCSEWKGAQVPDNKIDNGVAASCENFAYVGTFDYSAYYVSYDSLTRVDLGGNKNADGTYTIPVPQLDTLSCTKMRIQVYNAGGDVVLSSEYKVPIMVENAGVTTTDELFSKHGVEGCRDCDVVVLKNATLQKAANGSANDMPEVRDMEVYAGGKLVIPNGTNYTMRKLVMRSKGDEVSVAEIDGEAIIADKLYHTKRIDAQKFYFFTLPYDCNVAEMMYYNEETLGVRGVDYVIKYYDGEGRANGQNAGHWVEFTGTTLKAGVGYILAVDASLNGDFNDNPKKEFLFPMTKTLLENIDKTVTVGTWGVGDTTIGDNHKGWNLVGVPFMSNYNPISATGLKVGTYEDGDWNDAGTIFTYNNSVTVPYVTMPNADGKTYTQKLASAQDLEPFKSFFIQVGKEGEIITDVAFSSSERLSKVARRVPEVDATLWIELKLKNSVDSDVTTIIVDEDKTSEYEIGSDLEKMIGYAQKPQFYSLQTINRLAFNALSSSVASVAIPLGFFAPQTDTYTISLNTEDVQNLEGVYLTDKTTGVVTNLLFDDYNFSSARALNDNRFSVAIVRAVTSVDNLLAEDSVAPFVHNRDLWINNAPIGSVLYVFDMLGREVISEQINKETLVYHLHMAGIYHVQIVSKDKKSVYKVVSY